MAFFKDWNCSGLSATALLLLKKVPALFRLHHARAGDLRRGQRFGKNDRLVVWKKPKNWERRYLPLALWRRIVPELSVRILRYCLRRPGYRTRSLTLVTTLVDVQRYPAEQLALLYAKRWQIELWFRDIKTSMGMEVLRCQSPKMIHKELEMFFIAYNLIRCLMIQASWDHQVEVQRLRFKGTVGFFRMHRTQFCLQNSIAEQKLRSLSSRNFTPVATL